MPRIKRAWDLKEEDLPYIMSPYNALSVLRNTVPRPASRYVLHHDAWYGNITESHIKDGTYVLLDFRPQYYAVDEGTGNIKHFLPSSLDFNIRNLLGITQGGGGNTDELQSEAKPDWWDEVKGATKQVVNDIVRAQAASSAEWMQEEGIVQFKDSSGKTLSAEEVSQAYRDSGKEALNILDKEQQGATAIAGVPAYPAVLLALEVLLTRGRKAIRHPQDMYNDMMKAVKDARSEAEALGNLGMEQAKRRLGHTTEPNYKNRYHGPDDMARDTHGRRAEWESKGNQSSSRTVAEDVKGNKQGSKAKNRRRAEIMREKQPKVGQPSNRQGGPYTQAEIDLWESIFTSDGEKRHISSHTNTSTGETVVFERDFRGNIVSELDRFQIENFDEAKEIIKGLFK